MTEQQFDERVRADIRRMVAAGETMPPPTSEFRPCWQCGGTKILDRGVCRMCDYRGNLEYEVRRA